MDLGFEVPIKQIGTFFIELQTYLIYLLDMYTSLETKTEKFKRRELKKVLKKLTKEQINFFNRLYGSIAEIPESKMNHAYFQCISTIKKNNKK